MACWKASHQASPSSSKHVACYCLASTVDISVWPSCSFATCQWHVNDSRRQSCHLSFRAWSPNLLHMRQSIVWQRHGQGMQQPNPLDPLLLRHAMRLALQTHTFIALGRMVPTKAKLEGRMLQCEPAAHSCKRNYFMAPPCKLLHVGKDSWSELVSGLWCRAKNSFSEWCAASHLVNSHAAFTFQ